jgi:hypothetical protein
MINLSNILNNLNIKNYTGKYEGPIDLINFKGIIHIPYAWSNLALYEALFLNIIYFIPSINFFNILIKDKDFFWSPPYREELIYLSEWYNDDKKNIIVYFDSWEDLIYKTNNLDYELYKNNISIFMNNHKKKYFKEWKNLLTY